MKNFAKPLAWLTVLVFLLTAVYTPSYSQLQAADSTVPSGKGDGLKITWYDAKRGTMEETKRALEERDKSKVIKTEIFSQKLAFDTGPNWSDPWIWAELTGFIKMPNEAEPGTKSQTSGILPISFSRESKARVVMEIDGERLMDYWKKPVPDSHLGKLFDFEELWAEIRLIPSVEGEYQYLHLCIGKNDNITYEGPKYRKDSNIAEMRYLLWTPRNAMVWSLLSYGPVDFSPESFYTVLNLQDLKEFIKYDDEKNTVTIDKYGVDVSLFEFGFKSDDESFQSFTSNPQDIGNKAGILMIREKGNPAMAIELGSMTINPPTDLKVVSQTEQEVNLTWSYPSAWMAEIKEFYVYRQQEAYMGPDGYMIIPDVYLGGQVQGELGRTASTNFRDGGVKIGAKYTYSVRAVGKNGILTNHSEPLSVAVTDVTPPTAPENLRVGTVITVDGNKEIVLSENPEAVPLGPEGEIGIIWDESSDNVGVAGYDIYERIRIKISGNKDWGRATRNLVSTKENRFVDTFETTLGRIFASSLTYYVVARDAAGNTSPESTISFTTGSYLGKLSLKSGDQELQFSPSFAYHNMDYTLEVENEVKSVTVIPETMYSGASVKVNGVEVPGGGASEPILLPVGESKITVEATSYSRTLTYTINVNRANMANLPLIVLTQGTEAELDEGGAYQAAGMLLRAKGQWKGTIDYCDGSGTKPLDLESDYSFEFKNTYKDNGEYQINLEFSLEDIALAKRTIPIKVKNVAPALTITGGNFTETPARDMENGLGAVSAFGSEQKYTGDKEVTIDEGSLFSLNGVMSDPGEDQWTLTADITEGAPPLAVTLNPDKTFTWEHTFYDNPKPFHFVTLKVTDDEGAIGTKVLKVNVKNVPPVVEAGAAAVVQKGTEFTRPGTFSDPGRDTWNASVDYGDGSGEQELALSPDNTFELKHIYAMTGSYKVMVKVMDNNGGTGTATFPVKVKEYVFTVEAGEDQAVSEGQALKHSVAVTGPLDRLKSAAVDYGDGTGEEALNLGRYLSGDAVAPTGQKTAKVNGSVLEVSQSKPVLSHSFKDDGDNIVQIKVVDLDGDVYEDSFKVKVTNAPPVVDLKGMNTKFYESLSCQGAFQDPGADTWTAVVDYGDGSGEEKLTLNSDKTFTLQHNYSVMSDYTVTVKIGDDDGGEGAASLPVTVSSRPRGGGGGGGASHDASLSNLEFVGLGPLYQNQPPDFTGEGFLPQCLSYRVNGANVHILPVTAWTAAPGATIATYDTELDAWEDMTSGEVHDVTLNPGTPDVLPEVTIAFDEGIIKVTARDGTTTKIYKIKR